MRDKRYCLASLTLVLSLIAAHAVTAQVVSTADPADVESIDAIISASYDVISGSKDEPRDWNRERSLFYPGSRHMPTRYDSTRQKRAKQNIVMYELLIGLHVVDHQMYQRYREGMLPILTRVGGGFRYDFTIDKTLRSEVDHPINRLFAIYFPDQASREAFFSDPEYRQVRTTYFDPAVKASTVIATYER